MKNLILPVVAATWICAALALAAGPDQGGFFITRWSPMERVRVNSPDTLSGPFKDREESKATGQLWIPVPENPASAVAAELYLELWGGHPGTAAKAIRINDRGVYTIPEHGSADENCVYSYPLIPIRTPSMRTGENLLQFTCEKGKSFWGHYIIDNACFRLWLADDHPAVAQAGLRGFSASVQARPAGDRIDLRLNCAPLLAQYIDHVEYEGFFTGYDESGDGTSRDWHGFTKGRKPQAVIGISQAPPFAVDWDLKMVPDQKDMAARAVIRFKDRPDLAFRTAPVTGLSTSTRPGQVKLLMPGELPRPFWSRASKRQTCKISLGVDPSQIEQAQLHVCIWDGGRGNVSAPFTLNGHALNVAGAGRHDLLYRIIEVDPASLKRGANEIAVLSDTEHHGIEVLLPGPALVIRTKPRPAGVAQD